jgi:hypothetical protein
MKHHAVLKRRQLKTPRRGELRAAVKDAAHAQEVQRLAQRINGLPGIHGIEA